MLGAIAYQYRAPLREQFGVFQNNLIGFFAPAPCTEAIPYTLGTFDTKFNISEDYFLSAIEEAEAVWEKPFGKNLFTYAPTDSSRSVLKINLVYDYRQQITDKLKNLGILVRDDRASYDMLKIKFLNFKTEYEKEKNIYDRDVINFNKKKQAYDKEVDFWNNKGGAPEQEYNKIEKDRVYLQALLKGLEDKQLKINEMADEINTLAVELNHLVSILNLSVEKYNTANVSRGESFEEGVYSSNGVGRQIDIYEFSNRTKLVRVLAHELGHALGIEHVNDPNAIMYELNQSNDLVLKESDVAELNLKCNAKK